MHSIKNKDFLGAKKNTNKRSIDISSENITNRKNVAEIPVTSNKTHDHLKLPNPTQPKLSSTHKLNLNNNYNYMNLNNTINNTHIDTNTNHSNSNSDNNMNDVETIQKNEVENAIKTEQCSEDSINTINLDQKSNKNTAKTNDNDNDINKNINKNKNKNKNRSSNPLTLSISNSKLYNKNNNLNEE